MDCAYQSPVESALVVNKIAFLSRFQVTVFLFIHSTLARYSIEKMLTIEKYLNRSFVISGTSIRLNTFVCHKTTR